MKNRTLNLLIMSTGKSCFLYKKIDQKAMLNKL